MRLADVAHVASLDVVRDGEFSALGLLFHGTLACPGVGFFPELPPA